MGERFDRSKLRYGRIIIMTDADVDGAHIASLLMTFFYRELPELVRHGHVYLAQPPLYRLTQGAKSTYAMNDADRERKLKTAFKPNAKVDVSRFKGLGEMPPAALKETTMDPGERTLLKVVALPETRAATNDLVESLMGVSRNCGFNSSRIAHAPWTQRRWTSDADPSRLLAVRTGPSTGSGRRGIARAAFARPPA